MLALMPFYTGDFCRAEVATSYNNFIAILVQFISAKC